VNQGKDDAQHDARHATSEPEPSSRNRPMTRVPGRGAGWGGRLRVPSDPRVLAPDAYGDLGASGRYASRRLRMCSSSIGQHLVKEPTEIDGTHRYSCDCPNRP
jgi:hypothetical protein